MWGSRDGEGGGMMRKPFTFLSLLSLLICMATVVLWVCTYSHTYRVSFWTVRGPREVMVGGGQMVYENEPARELDRLWFTMLDSQTATINDERHELEVKTRREAVQLGLSGHAFEIERAANNRTNEMELVRDKLAASVSARAGA